MFLPFMNESANNQYTPNSYLPNTFVRIHITWTCFNNIIIFGYRASGMTIPRSDITKIYAHKYWVSATHYKDRLFDKLDIRHGALSYSLGVKIKKAYS